MIIAKLLVRLDEGLVVLIRLVKDEFEIAQLDKWLLLSVLLLVLMLCRLLHDVAIVMRVGVVD